MQASYPFCHVTQLNLISLPLNDAPSAQPQTLSLPDALPISPGPRDRAVSVGEVAMAPVAEAGEPDTSRTGWKTSDMAPLPQDRSEEHTSELQSRGHLVCRLLLEKKKNGTGRHQRRCRICVID